MCTVWGVPAALFLHPFAIRLNGSVATAEQGSDAYIASQLAVIVGTRLGERDMVPAFGVPDAAFTGLSASDIQTCLDSFGPDGVTVSDLIVSEVSDAVDAVTVEWVAE